MTNLNENLLIPEPYISFLEAVEDVPEIWAIWELNNLYDCEVTYRKS